MTDPTFGQNARSDPSVWGRDPVVEKRCVEAAEAIAERLLHSACWDQGRCTWHIMTSDPDRAGSGFAVPKITNGELYEGAAGIAIFLAEIYAKNRIEAVAETARGAINFALNDASALPHNHFGLHTGRVGVAYAAVRAGLRLGMSFREEAEAILHGLVGEEDREQRLDVIGGSAGATQGLLWMSSYLDSELTVEMACRLADRLIAVAHRGTNGWSWGGPTSAVRNLCGYSHGASGMAHAFLELYQVTEKGEYRYAAEQALRYERRFLAQHEGNWPDFRHPEVTKAVAGGRLSELRERLRSGKRLSEEGPGYMTAWCHGAPGIGLTRLRAYELLGASPHLREARIAISTTLASLCDEQMNYSLCHGASGNCETLLTGAEVLREAYLWRAAADCALRGIVQYEVAGKAWPCGTQGGVTDPGLLLGEAGIGLFLLRVVDPEVESILFVTSPGTRRPVTDMDGGGYRDSQERAVQEYFQRTLTLFRECGVAVEPLASRSRNGTPGDRSDVEVAHDAILDRISREERPESRELLEDASRLDRERYHLIALGTGHIEALIETLARNPAEEADWNTSRFRLAHGIRIVASKFDWDTWRVGDRQESVPEARATTHLLQTTGGRVSARPLTAFASVILTRLAEPATLTELVDTVSQALASELDSIQQRYVEDRVRQQLHHAYEAGVVTESRPEPLAQRARSAHG